MKRKILKRKSAESYPPRRENKRELLKASNETHKPQKKERKKLSPEARKQTRTSESLKKTENSKEITQKNALGFSSSPRPRGPLGFLIVPTRVPIFYGHCGNYFFNCPHFFIFLIVFNRYHQTGKSRSFTGAWSQRSCFGGTGIF